jgi:hypothetical protein
MEIYSAIKKNEILSFTSKWMEPENINLSEVSQAQKTKTHMFSLTYVDFRSKTNSVILDSGHTLKGEHIQEE